MILEAKYLFMDQWVANTKAAIVDSGNQANAMPRPSSTSMMSGRMLSALDKQFISMPPAAPSEDGKRAVPEAR
jgi:hypothetical protein